MKKSLLFGCAIALISSLGCNKVEEAFETPQEVYKYTFLLKDGVQNIEATKSSFDTDETGLFLKWDNNDQLTTITNSSVSGNTGYSYSQNSKVVVPENGTDPITFTISSYKPLNKDDMVYCASPYIANPGTNPKKVTMSISPSQKQNVSTFDGKYLPMVAVPFPISAAISTSNGSNSESEAISFYALGSVIEFDVFSPNGTYTGENIQKITFTTTGTDYISGSFDFDMTAVNATDSDNLSINGYTGNAVEVEVNSALTIDNSHLDKDHAAKVYMVVAPGTHSGTLTVNTNVAKYTYTIPSRAFKRAAVRRFGVNLEKQDVREEPKYYRLVSEAKEDYSGTYLVVYNGKAMDGSDVEASSNTTASVSIVSNKIEETTSTKTLEVTVTADGDHYTLKDQDGKYIYMSSTTSSIGVSSDKQYVDFEFSDSQLKCKTTNGVYLKNKDGNKTKFYTGNNPLVSFYLLDGTGVNITKVSDPVISCENNTVTITCSTKNAVIYYTTDGSVPSSSNGTTFTTPFVISGTTLVKAIATKSGLENSEVSEESCTYVAPAHSLAVSGDAIVEESNTITLTLGSAANDIEVITVTSNYAWDVTELSNSGYTITEATGNSGNGTITIKANNANDSTTDATNLGSIKVYETAGELEKTIVIKQAPKSQTVAKGATWQSETLSYASHVTGSAINLGSGSTKLLWTLTSTGTSGKLGTESTKGLQIMGSGEVTAVTTAYTGGVESITLGLSKTKSGPTTLSTLVITVDGKTFTNSSYSIGTSPAAVVFTCSEGIINATGKTISLKLGSNSNSVYVQYIKIN